MGTWGDSVQPLSTPFTVRFPFACRNGKTLFRGGWKVLLGATPRLRRDSAESRNDGAVSATPTLLSTNAIAMITYTCKTKDQND